MHDKPQHRTEFMISLYRQYADELREVREQQRQFYRRISTVMFDDVEGEWLYLLIRHLGAQQNFVQALEIGSGSGMSTSWILQAINANSHGFLTSLDYRVQTNRNIIPDMTKGRWHFINRDILDLDLNALPILDFLLIDSDHDSPKADNICLKLFPRVRSGGFIGVHDVYAFQTPRHGEAVTVFEYLEKIGVYSFTPAKCFPESWEAIQNVRKELQLGENIHFSEVNPLLLFQVP